MLFNSLEFLIFLCIFFSLYWLIPLKYKLQNILIVFGSYIFYGWWDWRFLSLILFSTIVDYTIGQLIANPIYSKDRKRMFLGISLFTNLGLLGFFKYFNFFVDSIDFLLKSNNIFIDTWSLDILLPVGISFYTFQTLSYSIDIYRGKMKATKDFFAFTAFVSFFPQLVAGPIERAQRLLPQFLGRRTFDYNQATAGISLIIYGFFKKLVIADRLAIYVNEVFGNSHSFNTISLSLAAVFFSFQIYCDFSAYSSIARGLAKLLGFELMLNFDRPYLSSRITEFWRRWHISLSTWFKDYLYIPLGGNRVKLFRNYTNILIVFLVSGLWHGANWTFVLWGGLHGAFQIVYLGIKRFTDLSISEKPIGKFISQIAVFLLVTFAWIFFRSESVDTAFTYILQMLKFDFSLNLVQICAYKGPLNLILSLGAIILLFFSYLLPKNLEFKNHNTQLLVNVLLLLTILILGNDGKAEFIYFQF